MYHLCYRGRRESFLCGIGTVFNQAILACDYWHSVKCSESSQHYAVNAGLGISSSEPGTSISTNSIVSKVIQETSKTLRPVPPPPQQQIIQQHQQTSSFRQIQPINPLTIVNQQQFQTEQFNSQQQQQQQPIGKTSFRQERRESSSSGLLSPSQQAQAALKFQSERSISSASGAVPQVVVVRSQPGGVGVDRQKWRVSSALTVAEENAGLGGAGIIGGETDAVQGAASELFTRSSAQSASSDDTKSPANSNRLQSLLKQQHEQQTINSIGPKLSSSVDDEWKPVTRSGQSKQQQPQNKKSSAQIVNKASSISYNNGFSNGETADIVEQQQQRQHKLDINIGNQLTTTQTKSPEIVESTTPTPTSTTTASTTTPTDQQTETTVTKPLEITLQTTKLPDLSTAATVPDNETAYKHEAASESQEVSVSKLPNSGSSALQFNVATEKPSTNIQQQQQDNSGSDNSDGSTQEHKTSINNNPGQQQQQQEKQSPSSNNESSSLTRNQSQSTVTASSDLTASSLVGLTTDETTTATTITTSRLSHDKNDTGRRTDTNQLSPPTTPQTIGQATTNNATIGTTTDPTTNNNSNTKDINNQPNTQ